ncbi:MAG TPA: hypothetical protein VLA19_05900 [Herpetosiphonaceae bacterium]|nr:hypothetical protein [Herpetosiphonaceae bacterium]
MSLVHDAILAYHALLDDDTARESQLLLDEGQRREGLFFGTRPLATVLRPHFITPEHLALLEQACGAVAVAARKVVDRILQEPNLVKRMAFTPGERALMELDPGYPEWSVNSRLDSFLDTETNSLQFIEYNAESPAAVAYEDVLTELFLALPVLQAFGKQYAVRPLPARQRLLEALLEAYRAWGGTDEPRIAIVDWKGLPTHSEFVMFQRYFVEQGLRSIICAPEDLSYHGGTLYASGEPVDMVYKRLLTAEFLERLGDAALEHPLVQAYRDHKVCIANNFRAKLLHKKAVFALLSDAEITEMAQVDPETTALVERHVPWTRFVEPGRTSFEGHDVDLIPLIIAERDRFVLKPNDDYGGHGISIGWETDADAWERAVEAAMAAPYVVQERVHIAYEDYPAWRQDHLEIRSRLVDTDPFLFGTDVQGCLTRLSSVTLLNVTAGGGSTVPTLVVDRLEA